MSIGVDFGGRSPLGSDTEGGKICLAPYSFLASNTLLAARNSKFWSEIEPECGKDLVFWFSEFGRKISQ